MPWPRNRFWRSYRWESETAEPAPAKLPEHERAALMGVGFEPTVVDVIAGRSGIGMRELLSALALLELKGYIRRDAGGAFVRNPAAGESR